MALKGIEPIGPQPPIRCDPHVKLAKWARPERIDPSLRIDAHIDKLRFAQHPQVARNSGLAEADGLYQLAHCALTFTQQIEQPAAMRLAKHLEHLHNVRLILAEKHMRRRSRLTTHGPHG